MSADLAQKRACGLFATDEERGVLLVEGAQPHIGIDVGLLFRRPRRHKFIERGRRSGNRHSPSRRKLPRRPIVDDTLRRVTIILVLDQSPHGRGALDEIGHLFRRGRTCEFAGFTHQRGVGQTQLSQRPKRATAESFRLCRHHETSLNSDFSGARIASTDTQCLRSDRSTSKN